MAHGKGGKRNIRDILDTAMGMQTSIADQGKGNLYKNDGSAAQKKGYRPADVEAASGNDMSPRAKAIKGRIGKRKGKKAAKKR